MRGTYYLLLFAFFCNSFTVKAQIHLNQTYPLLSDSEISTLFPAETFNQLVVTGCLEDEWLQLKIDAITGVLQSTSPSPQADCNSIQLADGQTLTFSRTGSVYQFKQYRGSSLVWATDIPDISIELTDKQVIAHPTEGFYICQPNPLKISKYDGLGTLVYQQNIVLPVGHTAQVEKVVQNGDLYLRVGHLGNNNRGVSIAKIDGENGTYLWQTEIETAEKITLDSKIAAHDDYATVAITHLYARNKGWEVTFLNAQNGRFINSESIFTNSERKLLPSIIPNKGIYLLESQSIDNQSVENNITLHRYNENGLAFWRKPLLNRELQEKRLVCQVTATTSEDLLLFGTRNDSLWMLQFNPTGDLSEVAIGSNDAPDLVMKISADRPDLPLYDFLTFTLIVRNEGGVAAENIRINAPFIDYQTLTATGEESVSHGIFYNWTGDWDIERLEAGEEAVLTIRTFVLSDQPTFRYFSVFEQFPADFDNSNNSILLNLPFTGLQTSGGIEMLNQEITTDFEAQTNGTFLQLQFDNKSTSNADLQLFNMNGKLVKKQHTSFFAGPQTIEMEVMDLPKGIYVLRRSDNGASKKVFVF